MTYRLVTRSDFDGLVCAVLLRELDLIDEILFVHPKDMQDGAVEITARDITTNLPYVPGAHLVFDHHRSETVRNAPAANHVIDPDADSAARVVFDHYGGAATFPHVSPAMMAAVDKADAARFTMADVLEPSGWELLSFLMDARTGLGRFRQFRISNYQLMMQLIDACREHMEVEEILALPDVAERVELYFAQDQLFRTQLRRCGRMVGEALVLDLRGEDTIHAGNRFLCYALYPEARVSVHVLWGRQRQNTVLAVGKSIFGDRSPLDVGALMLELGGGGHANAGTCQVDHDEAADALDRVVGEVNAAAATSAVAA